MRVLFIENRQQTWFWMRVAERLSADGHEVSWLVQNHAFAPRLPRVYSIPYPSAADKTAHPVSPALLDIARGDRNVLHFGGNVAHYGYYHERIKKVFDVARPEIVFGETTLFHETMAVREARGRGVLYLQPHITRYPVGRFFFFTYDTLEPFGGSGEKLAYRESLELANAIAERRQRLMYLGRPEYGAVRRLSGAAQSATQVTWSWIRGERYNTPSPIRKILLGRSSRRVRAKWEKLALDVSRESDARTTVLYPIQMQPEANLDIWGQRHRDQPRLLRSLVEATDDGTRILVKPNPHSKYEMTEELIDVMRSSSKLVALPHRSAMSEVLPAADLLVTVTGTVAIEAFCAGKPVATLTRGLVDDASARSLYIDDPSALDDVIAMVRANALPPTTDQDRAHFIQRIVSRSYVGDISNPLSTAGVADEPNISRVTQGFRDVLHAVATQQRVAAPELTNA